MADRLLSTTRPCVTECFIFFRNQGVIFYRFLKVSYKETRPIFFSLYNRSLIYLKAANCRPVFPRVLFWNEMITRFKWSRWHFSAIKYFTCCLYFLIFQITYSHIKTYQTEDKCQKTREAVPQVFTKTSEFISIHWHQVHYFSYCCFCSGCVTHW